MIHALTHDPLLRLTIARTRRADLRGTALAHAHRDVGRLLSREIARSLPLEEVEIEHVTGSARDVRILSGAEPVVVAMLRSGLFLAEGVHDAFPDASLVLHRDGDPLDASRFARRVVCVVDAVINTGASIRRVLDSMVGREAAAIVVVALVAYRPTVEGLEVEYPGVDFVVGRMSERSYVGRGSTDTGARLFGTVNWET